MAPDDTIPGGTTAAGDEREPRRARLVRAVLTTASAGSQPVVLRNFSPHGVGGKATFPLVVGERLWVSLPGAEPIAATVRWVRGENFGLFTDEPLDLEAVRTRTGPLSSADAVPGFQIIPPPIVGTRRPAFRSNITNPEPGKSYWDER